MVSVDSSGGSTILLVDSDATIREVLVECLELAGFRVFSSGHPEDALRLAEDPFTKPDVLVTEICLNKISGIELSHQMKERVPGLRTLYIGGYADEKEAQNLVREPGSIVFVKPFRVSLLVDKIRELTRSG